MFLCNHSTPSYLIKIIYLMYFHQSSDIIQTPISFQSHINQTFDVILASWFGMKAHGVFFKDYILLYNGSHFTQCSSVKMYKN